MIGIGTMYTTLHKQQQVYNDLKYHYDTIQVQGTTSALNAIERTFQLIEHGGGAKGRYSRKIIRVVIDSGLVSA